MNRDLLIDATIQSLRSVKNPRLFRTERGYQGEFFCSLQDFLKKKNIVDGNRILEMEYQKSARHGIGQRPDIILHVPTEISGADVAENNYAVWALKHRATNGLARGDFEKLDEMFSILNYPIGFFINIDSNVHHFDEYTGAFKDRLIAFAVQLNESNTRIKMACGQDNRIVELEFS